MSDGMAKYDQQKAILPYLLPSESIVWTGTPPPGLLFRKYDLFVVPFSLVWGGFAFFWEYAVFNSGAPAFFLLFGAIFVLIGLHLIIGRFFTDMLARKKTVYALTDQRVLILGGFSGKTLRALSLRNLPEVSLELHGPRSGTIAFGAPPGMPNWSRTRPARLSIMIFERIDNAGEVYRMIQETQNNQGSDRAVS